MFLVLLVMYGTLIRSDGASVKFVAMQQSPDVAELFEKLRLPDTTTNAFVQLAARAKSDPSAKTYLGAHLPALIDEGPEYNIQEPTPNSNGGVSQVWLNAVALAGKLKVTQAIPVLTKWISVDTSVMGSLSTATALTNNPAAQALIQIGNPAVPALQAILQNGKSDERWGAYRTLAQIGTPQAGGVLRRHLPHETDPGLAAAIRQTLSKRKFNHQ